MKQELVRSIKSKDVRVGLERVEPTYKYIQDIKSQLEETVFGQGEAMEALARGIGRHEAGLNNPNHPLAVIMLAGPTGTGKTESARALAKYLFNQGNENLKIVNCSEFSEGHTISRITGSPPGYVGYGDPPLITAEFLARRNVIVFDEIEKAHPALWRILLSVIDTGHLDSRQAGIVNNNGTLYRMIIEVDLNFSNSYIILTSNVGAEEICKRSMGFVPQEQESMKSTVLAAIDRYFRFMPEFLGRIDETIIFNHLTRENYIQIFWKFLGEINKNLERFVLHPYIACTQECVDYLVDLSVGKGKYGARDMRSVMNRELLQPLSDVLPLCYDRVALVADVEDGKIVFYQSPEKNEPAPRLPDPVELQITE